MIFRIVFLILLICSFFSCRFGKPILKFKTERKTTIDSLTNDVVKTESFKYLNFRRAISIGRYSSKMHYNSSGILTFRSVTKETQDGVNDGTNRYYFKKFYYDTLGTITNIHYKILQNSGRSGKTVYEKNKPKENGL